jgi:hypothetical protein
MDGYRAAFAFPDFELARLQPLFSIAAQVIEKLAGAGDERGERSEGE